MKKQVFFNLLTGGVNKEAMNEVIMSEKDFWRFYMRLLDVRNNSQLNHMEIEVMAYILAGEPDVSYFKGEYAEKLRKEYKLNRPALSRIKNNLTLKKYLKNNELKRGDSLPIDTINKFQKVVKKSYNKINFSFIFPIEINENKA